MTRKATMMPRQPIFLNSTQSLPMDTPAYARIGVASGRRPILPTCSATNGPVMVLYGIASRTPIRVIQMDTWTAGTSSARIRPIREMMSRIRTPGMFASGLSHASGFLSVRVLTVLPNITIVQEMHSMNNHSLNFSNITVSSSIRCACPCQGRAQACHTASYTSAGR